MTSVIEQWQAQTLVSSVKPSRLLDTVKEPPNALILCVNLQNLPLADTVEWVRHASEDEIKAHKGLRCGFFVAHILYPGFTYVSAETHKGGAGGAGGDKAALRGERLAIWDDEALRKAILLFGYKGAQQSEKPNDKQGARYVKTKRYDECASVGKGMVISASIWANKLQNSIKKPSPPPYHNLAPFQLCLVQLGIKSVMSNSEKGMMLDIKHVTPVEAPYSLSMCDLVSNDLPPHSLQESAEFRTRFLEGALVTSEQHRKHLNQDLIKGNFSTTMHLLALSPEPRHGAIAVAADGKLKLFQQQPMGDVSATTIELSYNAEIHGVSPNEDASVEWLAKLFNIAMMLGALELLVIVDEYRMRNGNNKGEESLRAGATSDVHLQAFARVNERLLLAKLVASVSAGALLDAAADQGIFQYITDEGVDPKHLALFHQCAKDVDLLVDTRRMSNKRQQHGMKPGVQLSSLVHAEGPWAKGHMLHVFYEKKCVLSLVISISDVQTSLDSSVYKRALEPVQLLKCADVDYDDLIEEEAPAPLQPTTEPNAAPQQQQANIKPPKTKKLKTMSQADTQQQPSRPPSP